MQCAADGTSNVFPSCDVSLGFFVCLTNIKSCINLSTLSKNESKKNATCSLNVSYGLSIKNPAHLHNVQDEIKVITKILIYHNNNT